MKSHCAYSLFGLGLFVMVTNIAVKHHVLITRNDIAHNSSMQDNMIQRDNAEYTSAMDGIINPQEFFFCDSAVLAKFEHKKKERTQHLFEELCGIKRTTVYPESFVICFDNTQQFGIPVMVDTVCVDINSCVLQRCMLVKQIASKLIAEKGTLSQKQCRLCVLEKLLK